MLIEISLINLKINWIKKNSGPKAKVALYKSMLGYIKQSMLDYIKSMLDYIKV